MDNQNNSTFIYYGTKCNTDELNSFIEHTIYSNEQAELQNRRKTPICIWGNHGIGKTQSIEIFAKEHNYQFVYIAPAQFEEMGDLLGMPMLKGQDGLQNNQTVFAPPEWVPKEEGPGIFLIDDVNRADDRILRGVMQLLQNYELISWKLPPKWQIILTANPDGGDYSVTPMDFSMLTRMMHITLTFDVKPWSLWAEKNHVDPRGISFILAYPEVVSGERTTPRTLVQFFENIQHIKDLKKEIALVKMLGDACLDANTVTSFISFVNNELAKLISPQDILLTKDFEEDVYQPIKKIVSQQTKRVDILSILMTRLINYVSLYSENIQGAQVENLKKFFKMDFIPNDLRLIGVRDIVALQKKNLNIFAGDPVLGKILLSGKIEKENTLK